MKYKITKTVTETSCSITTTEQTNKTIYKFYLNDIHICTSTKHKSYFIKNNDIYQTSLKFEYNTFWERNNLLKVLSGDDLNISVYFRDKCRNRILNGELMTISKIKEEIQYYVDGVINKKDV